MEIYGVWITKGWNRDLDNTWFYLPGYPFPFWGIEQEQVGQVAEKELREYSQYEVRPMPDETIAQIPDAAMVLQNWLTIQRLRIELEKAQETARVKASPFEVEAIGIIADLVAASVANPEPKHESFDWAWNELTDSAQEQVKDAYRKAVDWLEIVSPSKATDVQEKYPLNPDGSIPGIPSPWISHNVFAVPLCQHDGRLYGTVSNGKVVEPCPICGKSGMEEGWRPPW